jgi:hypothetical protein
MSLHPERMHPMKPLQILLSTALTGLSTLTFAQSGAQKSFDQLKSLAGSWEGTMDENLCKSHFVSLPWET